MTSAVLEFHGQSIGSRGPNNTRASRVICGEVMSQNISEEEEEKISVPVKREHVFDPKERQ